MAILLPFLASILLFLLFHTQEDGGRNAVLSAAIAWGVLLTVLTEVLSLFHAITFAGLSISWLIINAVLLYLCWRAKAFQQISTSFDSIKWSELRTFNGFLLACVGLIVGLLGIVAAIAPPNNWDSMAYTMPRVIHWMQNQSVAHYPTHYTPQLYNNPWAEFALLHFQILSGGDYFANFLQWFCLIGSLIAVSLIAQELGADRRGQIFAVAFCATLPNGILQASNTKNTYVVAFWLICFVYYGLVAIQSRLNWKLTFLMASSLSLAILTKGTAYAFAFPFVIWFFLASLKKMRFQVFKYSLLAIGLFLLINFGHYWRNLEMFGSPTATVPYKWSNDIYTVPAILSNVIRNASLHAAIAPILNTDTVEKFVIWIHRFLPFDPTDARTTLYADTMEIPETFTIPGASIFEDTVGNPLQFWLIPVALILLITNKKLRRDRQLWFYSLAVLASFLMFSLLIKWQIWHSRLHLPFFVLLCPVLGIVFAAAVKEKIAQYVLILVILFSYPYLVHNELRPLVGDKSIFTTDRLSQYFSARFDVQQDYVEAAQIARENRCQNVGLISRPDAWEYPLWVLLNQQVSVRLEHINVQNQSNAAATDKQYQAFQPCSVVSIGQPATDQIKVNAQVYQSKWRSRNTQEMMQVFTPTKE